MVSHKHSVDGMSDSHRRRGNHEEHSASIELRSDVHTAKDRHTTHVPVHRAAGGKFIGIVAGAILVLIIIGLGVYAGLRPSKGNEAGDDTTGGIFRELPGSGGSLGRPKVSGLSGRECDDAGRRAIGVMLSSDPVTRPVSGFAGADLVWELPVLVSDVTRFLAVYQCGQPEEIGSVRSVRHDYLFLAEGLDAIIGHWGGSYHALNRVAAGEFQTINALSNPFDSYYRKNNIQAPYNGFTSYERLWNALQQLGYRTETTFKGYDFAEDSDVSERGAAGTLTIAWPGQYRVSYEYDPETNRYQRHWAGVKQLDGATNEPVAPSAVAVIRATNEFADGPGGYNDVGIEGDGELTVYQNGQVIKGTWHKDERYKNDPMHMMDENGKDITFTAGQLWLMAVEPGIDVTWEQVGAIPASESVQ